MTRLRRHREGERFTSVEEAMAVLDILEERIDRLWDRLDALLDRTMEIEKGEKAVRSKETNHGQKGEQARSPKVSLEES